ncbi:hypothetical protein UPYG_G00207890 [Umbra pygmaea]|uniref:Lysosome-associated membrane glycoprotein 2 n=1 Tax=Umbra pygmaea TaxID=75934 RepID=A0ABD0WPM6_UMBPY
MFHLRFLVLFLALGSELHLTHATEVSFNNEDKKLCLYANLMVNFSVIYDVGVNKSETVSFDLPENVTTNGSVCGNTTSTLKLSFGDGHSWTVNFTTENNTYQADTITFAYNLSDSSIFPNSTSNETKSVTVKPNEITQVRVNTYYSCKSQEFLKEGSVNQTLYDVSIQAFVSNGSKSENFTMCANDVPTTTVAPTTNASTTAAPTSIPTPPPTLPTPSTGDYRLNSTNVTVCLKAVFGLRVGYKEGDKEETVNLVPIATKSSGDCGDNSSDLVLTSDRINITFTFINDNKKFRLHGLSVTILLANGTQVNASNTNMSIWEATVGSSYMCNKEQTVNVSAAFTLYTFQVHVQPFGVKNDKFATAHECSMDDTSLLIPIIVGAALAGLIVVVVIAYMIGRRKTYVGYQTL